MIRNLDKTLKTLEFSLLIDLGNFTIALTDDSVGNRKLMDVGVTG
jgi:hypothetical protein